MTKHRERAYNNQAVCECGRPESLVEKEMKKFLTNGFRFDILNKLLLRSGGQKKLRKRRELIENLEKRSKKVLDKRNLI